MVIINKITLFSLGLIPFVVGFLMNSWILKNPESVLPFILIGFIFLAFWIVVGSIGYKIENGFMKSALIAHLPAFLMLLLIMYQEIIEGQYWMNLFGMAPQIYYLPLVSIVASVIGLFSFLMSGINGLGLISLLAFLLMFAAYYFGYLFQKSRTI